MRASLDTNVIIHLYRAGIQSGRQSIRYLKITSTKTGIYMELGI